MDNLEYVLDENGFIFMNTDDLQHLELNFRNTTAVDDITLVYDIYVEEQYYL